VFVCCGIQLTHFLLFDNWHEVQRGRVYRSSQLSGNRLLKVIGRNHVRTVINLRGPCPDFAWYHDECQSLHAVNVSQEDIVLSAIRLPPPVEIQRLVEVLDRSEYPVLLHCRQGVDRTGLAAVVVRLLEPRTSLTEARMQLSLRYGYMPFNGTENVLQFIDLYEEWLQEQKLAHSPEVFRYWVKEQYCPGGCRAELELAPGRPKSTSLPAYKATTVTVRAFNKSNRPWRFRPGTWQGVHARYQITAADGTIMFQERAGLFDAIVHPGEAIDLTVGIPRLSPGKFRLFFDLVDVDQNAFSQYGVDPIFWDFEVIGSPD